jgi:hypothetical protein
MPILSHIQSLLIDPRFADNLLTLIHSVDDNNSFGVNESFYKPYDRNILWTLGYLISNISLFSTLKKLSQELSLRE